jgi:hypothetical protein
MDRLDPLVARRRRLAPLPTERVALVERSFDRDYPLRRIGVAGDERPRIVLEAGRVG